jgi:hypothetical protein
MTKREPWALSGGQRRCVCAGTCPRYAGIGLLMAGYAVPRTLGAWHVARRTPVSALILAYIYTPSVALALRRGGIVWRDSFYPRGELRRPRV